MKKSIIPVAAFIAGMAIVPSVFAAGETVTLGTVKVADTSDCYMEGEDFDEPDVDISPKEAKHSTASEITVTFNSADLHYVGEQKAADDSNKYGARPEGYAWVGFDITAPEDAQGGNSVAVVTLDDGSEVYWKTVADSTTDNKKDHLFVYKGVDADALINATKAGKTQLTYTYIFDWNGIEEGGEQTVNLVIKTTAINLFEDGKLEYGTEPLFTPEMAAANIAAAPEADADDDATTDDGETNPNTADSIATYLTIATVALLGLGATAFVAKKSNR